MTTTTTDLAAALTHAAGAGNAILARIAFTGTALAVGATVDEIDVLWVRLRDTPVPDLPSQITRQFTDALRDVRRDLREATR